VWTDKNRAKYDRDHLRYPSDLTDDEWAYVEPLIPPARRGGGKRRVDMRAVMNGVMIHHALYVESKDDRDGRSQGFRRECRSRALCDDYSYSTADQVGRQFGQPAACDLGRAVFESHVLALDIARFA
jgi:hypothetical protein